MTIHRRTLFGIGAGAVSLSLGLSSAFAQKKYDEGATDAEIKIGQTMPYSGNLSAYGTIGRTEAAIFQMINEKGGINGRKINFISYDDGYSPPKAVEMTRKLVEEDKVLLTFHQLGTPTNSAIHKYMNAKKIPHLFLATGASDRCVDEEALLLLRLRLIERSQIGGSSAPSRASARPPRRARPRPPRRR